MQRCISASVGRTHSDFSMLSQQLPLPSHSLPASKDFSPCSLIPVSFSSQAKGNQQATHGWMCRFEGGGRGGIKRKGEPPSQSSHTHSPCLSLEGKQSLHSQGWAVKCLSFLSIQHLLPMALPPSPLHLERKTLARNKSGEYLKRIKCGLFLLSSYFLTWEQNIFVYLILRIKFSWNYVFKLMIGNAVFVTKPLLSLITKNMTHLVECSELV